MKSGFIQVKLCFKKIMQIFIHIFNSFVIFYLNGFKIKIRTQHEISITTMEINAIVTEEKKSCLIFPPALFYNFIMNLFLKFKHFQK